MNHSNSTIAKNTIFLYIRMLLTMFVSLFTVRIVLNVLGVTDYGIYAAIGGVVTSLSFISGTLANASQRFFLVEMGEDSYVKLNKVFNTVFVTFILIVLVITIILETVGLWFLENKMVIPIDKAEAAQFVFQFSLFSFLFSILTIPFQAMVISKEDMSIYAYISILEVVLKLLAVYALYVIPFDKLSAYACFIFVASLIPNIAYIIICKRKYIETKISLVCDKKLIRSIFSYSSWTLFGTISGVINTQGVNILLNVFFGPIVNAAYAIATQVSNAVTSFATNFYTALRPPITKSFTSKDFVYMNKLFYFSNKALFGLLYILVLPLYIETEQILSLWLGTVEPYMVEFVRLMLIYTLVLSMNSPITTIVQAAGKVKMYHGLVDGFAMISLPIIYLLFLNGAPPYIAFLVVISVFLVAHIIRLFVLKQTIEFSILTYIKKIVLPASIIVTISYGFINTVVAYLPTTLLGVLITILLSFIITLVLCVVFLLSSEERQIVCNYLTSLYK